MELAKVLMVDIENGSENALAARPFRWTTLLLSSNSGPSCISPLYPKSSTIVCNVEPAGVSRGGVSTDMLL